MDQNNTRKRTRSTIHKQNMRKMKRFRRLTSTDQEFLSFRHGFLEQESQSNLQNNDNQSVHYSSNGDTNAQSPDENHEVNIVCHPLCEDNVSGGYASDNSEEEFRIAERIEYSIYINPERIDDKEYNNCEYSEYHDNINSDREKNCPENILQCHHNKEATNDNDDDGDNDDNNNDDEEEKKEEEEEEDSNDNGRQPFFQTQPTELNIPFTSNPNIHQRDHLLSTIAMAVRNNFSYEATLHLLKWLKISHSENTLPTTKKALWKSLNRNDSVIIRHLYCQECKDYLEVGKKLTKECLCKECDPTKKSPKLKYFLQIDLIKQLTEFFCIPNIEDSLNYKFSRKKRNIGVVEDIYDGTEYITLSQPGNFLSNPHNYSLTFNTDGCQLANASSASGWPIYVQINELSPHMRKKYIFLAGIYVDTKHPLMNNYLAPFINQMKDLYTTGIRWKTSTDEEITSKFIITTCSVDSPARALVTRMNQFNGYFGCTFCYAKGEREAHKHIYPLNHCFKPLRTTGELLQDMKTASSIKMTTNGVKGISSLITLPEFDMCKGTVVEAMHAAFLGAEKQHTELLLSSTTEEYYIGAPKTMERIDQRLLSIKPPTRRSRVPRSITTHNQWKASEWRNWGDYASVCLENILDRKYVEHFAILSQALHYLNNDSVSSHELDIAENLIIKYVTLFQDYFGKEHMTFNLHLLTHLPNTVRRWGPIWAHNAFSFESWNKKIVDKITSAIARADQIATRYLMAKFIESAIYSTSVAEETKKFICDIMKIVEHNIPVGTFINIGSSEARLLTVRESECLRRVGIELPEKLTSYTRVKLNKIEYKCEENPENKFCNAYIHCKTHGFAKIQSIVEFETGEGEIIRGFFIQCYKKTRKMFNIDYIVKIQETNNLRFVGFDDEDIKPAVKIVTVNGVYAFPLANCWETD